MGERNFKAMKLFCELLLVTILFCNISIFGFQKKVEIDPEIYILTAKRTDVVPNIDGYLEEKPWSSAQPVSRFIQKQPAEGQPATEDTEVRIMYDSENLYIGIMCYDSQPEKIIATERRRDSESIYENDHIQIMLDTFHDKRNGYVFVLNPRGAKLDLQVRKEGRREGSRRLANPNVNTDWDTVWEAESAIWEEGWSSEIKIPFRSLRFRIGPNSGWGINFLRNIRRKNEESSWVPLPRNLNIYKISLAGELRGLTGVKKGLNLQVKPYLLVDRVSTEIQEGELEGTNSAKPGIDIKYGLTSDLTLDITANTDFSQVEADEQQINLTRFSLYFPEKREFFLENSAIFSIGTPEDALIFFSRRIGISSFGEQIPVLGGVKIAGKLKRFNVGFINLQTKRMGDIPSNNFTVFRLNRDIMNNSTLGFMVTNKQSRISGGYNRTFVLDGDFILSRNFSLNGYYALSSSEEKRERNRAGKLGFVWKSDLFDVYGCYFDIQENFNPEMGFVQRTGVRNAQVHAGFTPEPDILGIKRLNPHVFFQYTTDQKNNLLYRVKHLDMVVEFINGGRISLSWNEEYEYIDFAFPIHKDIYVSEGSYTAPYWRCVFNTDKSRNIYTSVQYRWGGFYRGNGRLLNFTGGIKPLSGLSSEIGLVYNDIDLPQGSFISHLLKVRLNYDFSTKLALMSLIQWNSETRDVSANIRLDFIFKPGSHIYFVYNERRYVGGLDLGIADQVIALKVNYLFNF
jgi:hypothetical protein